MKYNMYFRSHTNEKMNKFEGATKEQIITALGSLLDTNQVIKVKIVRIGQ